MPLNKETKPINFPQFLLSLYSAPRIFSPNLFALIFPIFNTFFFTLVQIVINRFCIVHKSSDQEDLKKHKI